MSSARTLALEVLLEWERSGSYAHDLIESAASRSQLAGRDVALLQNLVLTTLRHVVLLDCWLQDLAGDRHLETRVHWLLRLGLAQLLILEMPPHAVVNESVEQAGKARSLTNAILRRADRERDHLKQLETRLPLWDRYSHPEWLVQRWLQQYGPEHTEKLCAWDQQPAPIYFRINRLHPAPLLAADLEPYTPVAGTDFYLTSQPPRAWLADGRCYVQDPSTRHSCELLSPQPGETILDACAAPGGKAAYLAQLMGNTGRLIAADSSPHRLRRLRENLDRLQVQNASVAQQDWGQPLSTATLQPGSFDAILIDAPCSNTGVMRRRVDVRWRLEPWFFSDMQRTQQQIIRATLPLLKPGGRLVYSTCSIDQEENEQTVAAILRDHPEMKLVETRHSLPWVDDTDGAFAALLVRS